jgi:hypothetical protein
MRGRWTLAARRWVTGATRAKPSRTAPIASTALRGQTVDGASDAGHG